MTKREHDVGAESGHRQHQALDRDRFDKCRALMERGATEGERAAARAAATRVAAVAGMTLAVALAVSDGARPQPADGTRPTPHPARRPYPFQRRSGPAPKPEPVTVEEILRQKAQDLARRKRAAAREEKRMRKVYADQEREHAGIREAQAARDREWAERRDAMSASEHAEQDAGGTA